VFIVHGYPGSSWDLQGVVERIGDAARTVVMDMRGLGLSEKPLDGDYQSNFTLMLQADLYDALADHLGLKTVLLVAHDMGQTVGLELMARFEESRTPFRIRHAILLDGSTLVDMIQPTEYQRQALAAPSTALDEDMPWEDVYSIFPESYSTESRARDDFDELVTCQSLQIFANHGSRTIGGIVHLPQGTSRELRPVVTHAFPLQEGPDDGDLGRTGSGRRHCHGRPDQARAAGHRPLQVPGLRSLALDRVPRSDRRRHHCPTRERVKPFSGCQWVSGRSVARRHRGWEVQSAC